VLNPLFGVSTKTGEDHATEVVIPLGEALGEQVNWNPGVKGSPHLFILGIPGQGKSWTTTRILSELGKQNVPALVLDFHGQFAESQSIFVKEDSPNVLDAARGLPFSPFECTRENGRGGWMANALAVAEIFAYVAGLGEMQKDVVYTSVRDAYKARGFDDNSDDDITHMLEYPTLKDVLKRIEQNEQARHVANVAARCRPLLEMDLFRPAEQSADLLSLVRSGLVIDLHNLFAETLQMAIGAFVLRKLYKDMFRWGYAKQLRLAIVLDEAHRLAKDITLPKLMKEGRKFGISVVVASQGIGDFHPDVLSNAGTKIIFRMNYPESRKVSGFIRGRQGQDLSKRIEQLSVGSAYIQTPEMLYGSEVKMYSPER
jgi:DNA phosphorothioation-dependent restriction protein DptH